jgi:hypothetical protein
MRHKSVLLGATLLASVAVVSTLAGFGPAFGQDRPESILPPGFGEPDPPKPPKPPTPSTAPSSSGGGSSASPSPGGSSEAPSSRPKTARPKAVTTASGTKTVATNVEGGEEFDPDAPIPIIVDIPAQSRRSTQIVGTIGAGEGEMGSGAFQNVNGSYLMPLLRGVKGPVASRWVSIFLRRALLSHSVTPSDINGSDWTAERASLLVRMGEAHGARSLVQAVDVDQYTPRMFDVALESAMAAADPAMLCGMTDYVKGPEKAKGAKASAPAPKPDEKTVIRWQLAKAMCSGLSGETAVANANLDRARDKLGENNVDALLAEKVVGAGANTRRSVGIEWKDVKEMTDWRFGLSAATGMTVPDALYATMPVSVKAWQALAPLTPAVQRLGAADTAAEMGVLSGAALVDVYSARYAATDPSDRKGKPFDFLRQSYAAANVADRLSAMRQLWSDPKNAGIPRFAGLIATARAAALVPVDANLEEDAPNLIASMLTVGLDARSARWASVIADTPGNGGWGLLAVGARQPMGNISAGMIDDFGGSGSENADIRAQFLFAGLAALGRIAPADLESMAERFNVPIGRKSKWTEALDTAVTMRAPGAVAALAAAGMQTANWKDVPAHHVYHIVRSLRAVGYEGEARMVAAEALMRI